MRATESIRRKLEASEKGGSEDKWFWSTSEADIIRSTSSEARSLEPDFISSEDHQELKIIRSGKN